MKLTQFFCPDDGKELRLLGVTTIENCICLIGKCPKCNSMVRVEMGDVMMHLLGTPELPTHFAS